MTSWVMPDCWNESIAACTSAIDAAAEASVVDELTAGGRLMSDWQKVTTDWFETPSGRQFQVHFYGHVGSDPYEADMDVDFNVRFRKIFQP